MKYVVDKIEGDLAVLENIIDGNIINLPIGVGVYPVL